MNKRVRTLFIYPSNPMPVQLIHMNLHSRSVHRARFVESLNDCAGKSFANQFIVNLANDDTFC